jgi:group I intron endonuclease
MKANIQHKGKTGVYCIRNIINGKVYIGKAKCIWRRIHGHLSALKLKNKSQENQHMINSFEKYGKENFEYFVLEYLPLDNKILSEKELYWMNFYNSTNRLKGYNLRMDSSTNMICHKETSIKISERIKKEWENGIRKDHGKKLSKNWKTTPERNKKQSEIMSKNLTKYSYNIFNDKNEFLENCNYSRLKELNLQNVLAEFFRKKSNKIKFKSFIIERLIIKDIV